jgi:hypothetical protein
MVHNAIEHEGVKESSELGADLLRLHCLRFRAIWEMKGASIIIYSLDGLAATVEFPGLP